MVFLNKCDMVKDEELLELVEMEGKKSTASAEGAAGWSLMALCAAVPGSARAAGVLQVPG